MSEHCQPCSRILCAVESDYDLYSLQGVSTPPPVVSASPFSNNAVTYQPCPNTRHLLFQFEPVADWVIGGEVENAPPYATARAGTFRGATQAEADAIALAALTDYVNNRITAGTAICDVGT